MEPTWKTRDGRVLKLTEMETTHLQHSMRMLERRRKSLLDSPLGPVFALALVRAPNFDLIGGEFAREAAENEYAEALEEGPAVEAMFPVYVQMRDELARRTASKQV